METTKVSLQHQNPNPNNSKPGRKQPILPLSLKNRLAMEQPSSVLQVKLAELESDLFEIFFHSAKEDNSTFYDEIMARIGFLKTLLDAEKESNAQGTTHHLFHIARRLADLEDAFHNWVDFGITPEDHLDDLSVCSCSHLCFDDVVEDDDFMPQPACFVPVVDNVEVLSSQGSEEDEGEKKKWHRSGGLGCGLLSAATAAITAMVIGLANHYNIVEEKVFLAPT